MSVPDSSISRWAKKAVRLKAWPRPSGRRFLRAASLGLISLLTIVPRDGLRAQARSAEGASETDTLIVKLKWEDGVPVDVRNSAKVYVYPGDTTAPQVAEVYQIPRTDLDTYTKPNLPKTKAGYSAWATVPGYLPQKEESYGKSLFSKKPLITLEMKRVFRDVMIDAKNFPAGSKIRLKLTAPQPDSADGLLFEPGATANPLRLASGTYLITYTNAGTTAQAVIPHEWGKYPLTMDYVHDFARGSLTFALPEDRRFTITGRSGGGPLDVVNGQKLTAWPAGDYVLTMLNSSPLWTLPFHLEVGGNQTVEFPADQRDCGWFVPSPPAFHPDLLLAYPEIVQQTQLFLRAANGAIVWRSGGASGQRNALPPGKYTLLVKRAGTADEDTANYETATFTLAKYSEARPSVKAYDQRTGFLMGRVKLQFDSELGTYSVTPILKAAGKAATLAPKEIRARLGVPDWLLPIGRWQLKVERTDASGKIPAQIREVDVTAGSVTELIITNSIFTKGKLQINAPDMPGAKFRLRPKGPTAEMEKIQSDARGVTWDNLDEGNYELSGEYLGEEIAPAPIAIKGTEPTLFNVDRNKLVQTQLILAIDLNPNLPSKPNKPTFRNFLLRNRDTNKTAKLAIIIRNDRPVYNESFIALAQPAGNSAFVLTNTDKGSYSVSSPEVEGLSWDFSLEPGGTHVGLLLTRAETRQASAQMERALIDKLKEAGTSKGELNLIKFDRQEGLKGKLTVSLRDTDVEGRLYLKRSGEAEISYPLNSGATYSGDINPGNWDLRYAGKRRISGRTLSVKGSTSISLSADETKPVQLSVSVIEESLDASAKNDDLYIKLNNHEEITFKRVGDASEMLWVSVDEISNAQYNSLMRKTNADDDKPSTRISWDEAQAFVDRLRNKTIITGECPLGVAVRLPTEREWQRIWELAADGDEAPPERLSSTSSNAPSIRNLRGNVWEYCLDPYAETINTKSRPTATDLKLDEKRIPRVLLGGSYLTTFDKLRSKNPPRTTVPQSHAEAANIGFRLVIAPRIE